MKNQSKSGVFNRLFLCFNAKSRAGLCKEIGVPIPTYDTWKHRGEIPAKALLKIAEEHGLNPLWLMTGNGDKYATEREAV